MWNKSFTEEIVKHADLISKSLFSRLGEYDQKRVIEVRDTIAAATDPNSKLPIHIKERMIEAAVDSLKNMSYAMANVNNKRVLEDALAPSSSMSKIPKKKYVL